MRRFRLEPKAAHRIDEIVDYTRAQWGAEQAEGYVRGLFGQFESIARHDVLWRPIPAEFGVTGYFCRYEHHYIYWKERKDGSISIFAILHERMQQGVWLGSDRAP